MLACFYYIVLTFLGSKHGSKRSTSSERKAVTPPNSHSKRPKRRSSASPPRKRRLSPPLPKSTKPSYTAATSRSGGNKSGGDRDLREQQRPSRSNWNSSKAGRSSLSPQRQQRKISKAGKKGQGTGANAVSIGKIMDDGLKITFFSRSDSIGIRSRKESNFQTVVVLLQR